VADITAIENGTYLKDAALSFWQLSATSNKQSDVGLIRNKSTNEPDDEHEVGHNMQIFRC